MFRQRELNVAMSSLRNYRTRKDVGKKRTVQNELFEESNRPTAMQMIARADEMRNRGKDREAEVVYAEIGRTYLSKKMFHSVGGFFRKAKMFSEAANAFMKCKEYFSAGRCFESAKDKEMAKKAYVMAGEQAEKTNNLSLAHHVYMKAGRKGRAEDVKKKAEEMQAAAKKRILARREAQKLRKAQKLGNDCLLPLPRFRKRGV